MNLSKLNRGSQSANIDHILSASKYFKDIEKTGGIIKKDQAASNASRKAGNALFQRKKHDEAIHRKILSHYTESAALAPPNSKELALAYNNRSIILLHLRKYNECLLDIEKTLQMEESSDLKSKLLTRQKMCLDTMKADRSSKPAEELPKIVPSKRIPCAAECVDLNYNKKFGRHMIATRNIKVGEVVSMEEAYSALPMKFRLYSVCSHCLEQASNAVPCDHCAVAVYCSEECKEIAKVQYHDLECSVLPYLYCIDFPESPLNNVILAIRIFIKAIKTDGLDEMFKIVDKMDNYEDAGLEPLFENGVFQGNSFQAFYNLKKFMKQDPIRIEMDHSAGSIMAYLLFKQSNFLSGYIDLDKIDDRKLISLKMLLLNIKWTLDPNNFTHQELLCKCDDLMCTVDCESNIGFFITIFSSFVNHHCNSNVAQYFIPKKRMVLYAVCPIKKGEQLFINYGTNLDMPIERRQFFLDFQYNFTCNCRPCVERWPLSAADPSLPELDPRAVAKFSSALKKHFKEPAEDVLNINKVLKSKLYCRKLLKRAMKVIELHFQYFDEQASYLDSQGYVAYMVRYYTHVYGSRYNIPGDCSF